MKQKLNSLQKEQKMLQQELIKNAQSKNGRLLSNNTFAYSSLTLSDKLCFLLARKNHLPCKVLESIDKIRHYPFQLLDYYPALIEGEIKKEIPFKVTSRMVGRDGNHPMIVYLSFNVFLEETNFNPLVLEIIEALVHVKEVVRIDFTVRSEEKGYSLGRLERDFRESGWLLPLASQDGDFSFYFKKLMSKYPHLSKSIKEKGESGGDNYSDEVATLS